LALDIYEMAIRILVASAAGALIGYERYVQEFRIASPETERTDMRAVDNAIEWPVSAGLLYGRCWPLAVGCSRVGSNVSPTLGRSCLITGHRNR
jgi:hypothetical protein